MAERILLFIPMYNCAPQIPRVIAQITPQAREYIAEVLVVDNRSTDNGQAAAKAALAGAGLPARLVMNDDNYGLGGSHKVAFEYAIANRFDYVIVLHGDDQARLADILPHLEGGAHRDVDALLGARFMEGSQLVGYSPIRTLGNHVFNALYSLVTMRTVHDLGSGLNLYRVEALADRWWLKNADDLTFNYHMILRSVAKGWKMRFFPLSWREEDQISNVRLVRQALRVASLPAAYLLRRSSYLQADYSRGTGGYTCQTVAHFSVGA